MLRISDNKREYVAKSLAKIAEFILSILVIGYLVTAKLDPKVKLDFIFIVGAMFISILILFVGVVVLPQKNDRRLYNTDKEED